MKDSRTKAMRNRAIRQEALRDQLSAQGHVQHVIEMAGKIADLALELDSAEVARLKAASEIKLKLINKYLPDLKSTELNVSGEIGGDGVKAPDVPKTDWAALRQAKRQLEPVVH